VIYGSKAIYNKAGLKHSIIGKNAGVLNVSAREAIVMRHLSLEERKENDMEKE
jgi:hypothetical protein